MWECGYELFVAIQPFDWTDIFTKFEGGCPPISSPIMVPRCYAVAEVNGARLINCALPAGLLGCVHLQVSAIDGLATALILIEFPDI